MFRLIAVAIALPILGCGGAFTDADRDRARQVVAEYGRAYANDDGKTGCRLLTNQMQERYAEGGESCPTAFKRIASLDDARQLRFKSASVTGPQDGGLRGIVEFSESNGTGMGGEVHLVEQDERWRLDQDLSCVTPSC